MIWSRTPQAVRLSGHSGQWQAQNQSHARLQGHTGVSPAPGAVSRASGAAQKTVSPAHAVCSWPFHLERASFRLNCTNCGTPNAATSKFCAECGNPLAAACPNCSTPYQPGAKFCAECGYALAGSGAPAVAAVTRPAPAASPPAASPDAAERRVVSVLFADLVGFTPFAEERDAEDVRDTLSRYFDMAREVIERYGGTVEKFIGDAVMAVWGAPTAHEDDAERAVRAALDLVDAVPALGTRYPGTRRRADRRGRRHGRRDEPGHGRRRPGQHGEPRSSRWPSRHCAGRRGDPARRQRRDRVRGSRRRRRSRARQRPSPRGGRCASSRERRRAQAAARRSRRRSSAATTSCGCSRTSSTPPVASGRPRLVSRHRPGRHRQEPPRVGVPEVHRRPVETVYWHDGRCPAYGEGITFWALGEMVRERAGLLETDDETTTREGSPQTVAEHRPRRDERRVDRARAARLLGFESRRRLRSSCSAPGGRSSSASPTPAPVALVFEDLHFADSGPARLHRPPARVEPRASPITSSRLPGRSCSSKRPDWGAGKRSFTSIYLEPLPDGHARAARRAWCRGCRRRRRGHRRARRRHPAVRGRDRADAPGRGPARARGRRLSSQPAT